MRSRLKIVVLAGLLLPASLSILAAVQSPPPTPVPMAPTAPRALPTIALGEVRSGQQGYGLSVFSGQKPERFTVQVIGVMRNVNPDNSYILARLTGQGLEKSGVIAGMSGSPVFLDDRLAGAVAFSWPFSHEAIAGITPIETMHHLSRAGAEPLSAAPPLPPVGLSDLVAGHIPEDLLARQLAALRPPMVGGAVPSVQWSTAGFGDRSLGMLREALGSVAPAGRAVATTAVTGSGGGGKPNPTAAGEILPGGSVAAVLVDGDLTLAATGTVTDRIGDQVYAFGHPFLGLGPTGVPMATADVVTVLSSQYSSFKIANIGDVVGAFEQDRQAGIAGRIGEVAPMVPMTVKIHGLETREFHMRLASLPQLMPLLIGSSTLGSLESASYTAGPQGIDLAARFKIAGHGELAIHQTFDGDNAGSATAAHVLAVASYLAQNPLEKVRIESVEVEIAQAREPRAAALTDVHADRSVVRPGEQVNLTLDLLPYRGKPLRHSFAVRLPEDLNEGKYTLVVADGASADAVRLSVEPVDPVSFDQALGILRSFHSHREVT
ncbi:MAG TPA: SpoIVB peptidase S55 domain-containing protein, partial [Thermoanaerobaculia bacterium]|nr:SpoIVB peptidase S55 domain-containing protein [Thermoanaerobaculia bacterium]